MTLITPRWYRLNYHEKQGLYFNSQTRFNVVPAGRRSGKTEIAKRRCIRRALTWNKTSDGKFVFGAPTHGQAREIYWNDVKAMVPQDALLTPEKPYKSMSETSCIITLWNRAKIYVLGLDKPERVEGSPIDHIVLDEYGNMKKEAWGEHIRPGLSTIGRLGTADLIGVPEGRNHYHAMAKLAMSLMGHSTSWEDSWSYFHWLSSEILSPTEIAAAKRDLDELTYQQEYEGSFVNFTGQAYYAFSREANSDHVIYNPELDLIFCFDFNVDPGTATVLQEQGDRTCVINEVYIPKNSNTNKVCDKLLSVYRSHARKVWLYGDATGGSRGSAKVQGSDWDLVAAKLVPVFGDRLIGKIQKSNPSERGRINAVNSRCRSMDGSIRLVVNPVHCPKTVDDFEGTILVEGGSGEIDKHDDPTKSHLTDGIGYYIFKRWPTVQPTYEEEAQIVHATR